jgi:GTP cyclohydrolase II
MGSQKCDCGYQFQSAIEFMSKSKDMNILIYLNQEGRGLGIHNKIISYNIQENGWNTYQADNILGFSGDERDYKAATEILKFFKIKKLNLITNNPEKIKYLKNNKINVNKIINIKPGINYHNARYLKTKKTIGKHLLKL